MTNPHPKLDALVKTIRATMKAEQPTEQERAQFVYNLVREVGDYAKYDVSGPDADTEERARLGRIADAALPPVVWPPQP